MKEETKKPTPQEKKAARAMEALTVEKYFRVVCVNDKLMRADLKVLINAYTAARESLLAALDARLLCWLAVLTYDFEEKPTPEKVQEVAERIGEDLPWGMRGYWLQVWRGRLKDNLYKYRLSHVSKPLDFGI